MSQTYCQFAFILHLKDVTAVAEMKRQYGIWKETLFLTEETSPGFRVEELFQKPTHVAICNEEDCGDVPAVLLFLEQSQVKCLIDMAFLSFVWVCYNERDLIGEQEGGAVFWDLQEKQPECTNLNLWLEKRKQQFDNRQKLMFTPADPVPHPIEVLLTEESFMAVPAETREEETRRRIATLPHTSYYWLSWWDNGQYGEREQWFPWWVSGSGERGDSIVAAVLATSEEDAKEFIRRSYDVPPESLEFRFCELRDRPAKDLYSDRFAKADWFLWV